MITVKYASVAQGIERRFPKPCVGCSNRLWGTIESLEISTFQGFFDFVLGFKKHAFFCILYRIIPFKIGKFMENPSLKFSPFQGF